MANRFYNQFRLALEKQIVDIYATVFIGTTGGCTLESWGSVGPGTPTAYASATNGFKGVKSVTHNSAGNYTFVFNDNYQRLLGAHVVFVSPSGTAVAAPNFYVSGTTAQSASVTNIQSTSGATVTIQTFNSASVAADPAAGERGLFTFTFGNSSAA